MSCETLPLDMVDAINERLHKASGIVDLIRVSNGQASEATIEHSAWAVEGLLNEIHAIVNGEGDAPARGAGMMPTQAQGNAA